MIQEYRTVIHAKEFSFCKIAGFYTELAIIDRYFSRIFVRIK